MSSGANSWQTLIDRNIQANLKLLGRMGDLAKAARQPNAGRSVDWQNLANDWNKLVLDYYGNWLAQNDQYLNAVIRSAEQALSGRTTKSAEPSAAVQTAARPELPVRARLGETVIARFQVDNNLPSAMNVSFEISDFVGQAGLPISTAAVKFNPVATSLNPGELRVIELTLHVSPALFQEGQRYRSTIRVCGCSGREIDVVLDVIEESHLEPESGGV
ncbi:MAG: hypothetical protein ACU836_14860 [Gammaproteobacteria bacterium]